MKLHCVKLHEDAQLPKRAHNTDAGWDLVPVSYSTKDGVATYGFGLAVQIPENHVGLLFPRSSIYKKDLSLTNSVGVIDAGYEGEILAKFRMHISPRPDTYYNRYLLEERKPIAQLVVLPLTKVESMEWGTPKKTERGTGNYGSTD